MKGIETPENFEKEIKEFINIHNTKALDDDKLDEKELLEIANRVKISLTDDEKEKLKILTKELKKIIHQLFSRQFLQLMAGSACKAHDGEEKFRSFNIYKIDILTDGYQVKCERYIWNNSAKAFNETPQIHTFEFKDKNRPLH